MTYFQGFIQVAVIKSVIQNKKNPNLLDLMETYLKYIPF